MQQPSVLRPVIFVLKVQKVRHSKYDGEPHPYENGPP